MAESHKERIGRWLLEGRWVCATDLLRAYMPAGRNRISELRQDGWNIVTQVCRKPEHIGQHRTRQIMYRLIHGPTCRCPRERERGEQEALL